MLLTGYEDWTRGCSKHSNFIQCINAALSYTSNIVWSMFWCTLHSAKTAVLVNIIKYHQDDVLWQTHVGLGNLELDGGDLDP